MEEDDIFYDSQTTENSSLNFTSFLAPTEEISNVIVDNPLSESSGSSPLQELLPTIPLDLLNNKVGAASNYVGSFFWPTEEKKEPNNDGAGKEEEVKEEKKDGGLMAGLGKMSSAFGMMPGFSKTVVEEGGEAATEKSTSGGWGISTSSLTKGLNNISSSLTMENLYAATGATTGEKEHQEEKEEQEEQVKEKEEEKEQEEDWSTTFSGAFSKVGKFTADYSKVLQDTVDSVVMKAPLLSDFQQEQEHFIKNKGDKELESAPWSGYINEDELKAKILALSEDRRNFIRAPPQGVDFDFEYSAVAAHAVVLLKEDKKLQTLRYELVPKKVKEEDFWRNYFYRMGIVKQSFELSNNMGSSTSSLSQLPSPLREGEQGEDLPTQPDQDDEFVSELHQASSKDLAEADEAMKRLGIAKNDAEWEAELEGELNEYEMVGGEEGEELSEEQIQAMLEAEK